jgi:hypothetical protein
LTELPKANRMIYYKTVFCIQLKTKKAQAKKKISIYENFSRFLSKIFK